MLRQAKSLRRYERDDGGIILDDLDYRILEYLQEDGRHSFANIGRRLGIADTSVSKRVERLINSGVVSVETILEPSRVGLNTVAMIGLVVDRNCINPIIRAFENMPEVYYVALVTGEYDLIIKIAVSDNSQLLRFLKSKLVAVPGILSTQTWLQLETKKHDYKWCPTGK